MNAEHTWADAPVMAHMFEEVLYDDMTSYDQDGNLLTTMQMKPPNPTRLSWEFTSELVKSIDEAYNDGLKILKVKKSF